MFNITTSINTIDARKLIEGGHQKKMGGTMEGETGAEKTGHEQSTLVN